MISIMLLFLSTNILYSFFTLPVAHFFLNNVVGVGIYRIIHLFIVKDFYHKNLDLHLLLS